MRATPSQEIAFLKAAKEHSKYSPDPSTKVGAVITAPREGIGPIIIGHGFNCFPTNCHQHEELYADRERKYLRVVHAEINALLFALRYGPGSVEGASLYVWPPSTGPTCARCAAVMIQAGIARVVYVMEQEQNDFSTRWAKELGEARTLYLEAGVEIGGVNLSPALFREYFGD